MAEPNHRVAIAVAVIGVIGTLGTALIANWDKVFPRVSQTAAKTESAVGASVPPPPPADAGPRIAGLWRDSEYLSNGSKIIQDGNSFEFTRWGVLPNGVRFNSTGTGRLLGQQIASQYTATYGTGDSSSGQCSGSVSSDAMRIDLNCLDSRLGSFANIAVRE